MILKEFQLDAIEAVKLNRWLLFQKIKENIAMDTLLAAVDRHVEEVKNQILGHQKDIIAMENDILDANNELVEVRAQMRRVPSNDTHLKRTVALLRDGLENMNQLKHSWTQLSIYFLPYRSLDDNNDKSDQKRELSFDKMQQHCSFIAKIAETYVYFSQHHILPYMCRLDSSLFDECDSNADEE